MVKKDVVTKEDLERYYIECRKIRFSEDFNIESEDLFMDIFKKLFITRVHTYTKTLKLQCEPDKNRSIDDFIKIVKYYIPELSVSDIVRRLCKITTNTEDLNALKDPYYPTLFKCNDIRKTIILKWNMPLDFILHYNNNRTHNTFEDSGFKNCKIRYSDL